MTKTDQQAAEEYAEKLYPFSAIIGKPDSFKFQCLKEARKQIKDTFLAGAAHVRAELPSIIERAVELAREGNGTESFYNDYDFTSERIIETIIKEQQS